MAPPLIYPQRCVRCEARIQLPLEMLAHITPVPTIDKIESPSVAFPCPRCKQVQTLSKEGFVAGQMLVKSPSDETVFLDWLQCEQEGCKVLTPLYAQWSLDTTVAEREADTEVWEWDGLQCPQGHAIRKPW